MRVGYLGPAGHVQRGGAARPTRGCPRTPSSSPLADGPPRRRRGRRRRGRPRARADRELARGLGQRDGRRARRTTRPTCAIVGERVLSVRYCLIARPGRRSQDVRDRALPSAGAGAVRALPARRAARGATCAPRTSTAEAVREAAGGDDARGGRARHRRSPASCYGAVVLREDVGDEPATRRASSGSRAPASAPGAGRRRGARGRRSLVFSGDGDGAARAGSCAACRSSPSAA